MEPFVPASCRTLRRHLQHILDIFDLRFRNHVPKPHIVNIVRRYHDLHISQRHLEYIVGFALAENLAILYAGNHARAMHRVDNRITNLKQFCTSCSFLHAVHMDIKNHPLYIIAQFSILKKY